MLRWVAGFPLSDAFLCLILTRGVILGLFFFFEILLTVATQSAGRWGERTARNGCHWAEAPVNGGEWAKTTGTWVLCHSTTHSKAVMWGASFQPLICETWWSELCFVLPTFIFASGCILPGSELHPAAGGGAQSRSPEFERKAKCAAVLEEPGGDAADRLPCWSDTCWRQAAHHQRPALRPAW